MKRLRWHHRTGKSDGDRYVSAYGFRIGYWPCMEAPYFQLALGKHRFEIWHGLGTEVLTDWNPRRTGKK